MEKCTMTLPRSSRSNFFELVYRVVAQVPKGRVTTYSAVAKYLNNPRGARAVGWAMRQCPYPLSEVPCHRVIMSSGEVGGWSVIEGKWAKVRLLRNEGVLVKGGFVDLRKYGFTGFTLPD